MEQDATVTGRLLTYAPGCQSPAEFRDQVVVTVGLVGDEPPESLAADADRGLSVDLIDNGKYSRRVFPVVVLQPGREAAQIFAIEKDNDLFWRNRRLLPKSCWTPCGKLT